MDTRELHPTWRGPRQSRKPVQRGSSESVAFGWTHRSPRVGGPDIYLGTTRFGEHLAIPGEVLHKVVAGGAELLYIVRPDTAFATDPEFSRTFRHLDERRLRILARGAVYSEKQGHTERAIYLHEEYANLTDRVGYPDEAIRSRAKAVYLKAGEPEEVNAQAEAMIRGSKFKTAWLLLEKLTIDHKKPKYRRNLLIALGGLGAYTEGLTKSRQYNTTYPNDAEGHAITALMLVKSNDPTAGAYLDSLRTRFPDNVSIRDLNIQYRMAR
jgi:hypothetical protein